MGAGPDPGVPRAALPPPPPNSAAQLCRVADVTRARPHPLLREFTSWGTEGGTDNPLPTPPTPPTPGRGEGLAGEAAGVGGEGQPSAHPPPLPSPSRTWAQSRRLQPDSPQAAVVWAARGGGGGSRGHKLGVSSLGEQLLPATHPVLARATELSEQRRTGLPVPHPVLGGDSPQAAGCLCSGRTSTITVLWWPSNRRPCSEP